MKILFVKTFLVILLPNLIQNTILDLNILNNPLLNKSPYLISKDLNESIYQFFQNFTNFSYITPDLNYCLGNLSKNDLGYMYIYSGKGIAEPGLELECNLLDNFTYFFLTYKYTNLSFGNESQIYQFIQQKSFYTGICIANYCKNFVEKILNQSKNAKFFSYLKKEWFIDEIKYHSNNNTNDKIILLIIIIIISIIFIQILFSFLYNCIYSTEQNEKNIVKDDDFLNENNNEITIFENKVPLISENKKTKSCCYLILSNFNISYFFNILSKKKNEIYDETNLEFIAFLRFLLMMTLTFIQNIYVLTEIPVKDFFDQEFYEHFLFFMIKFSSFSLDLYISIEGFLMIFKLLSFIKKNVYSQNKNNVSFFIFLIFIYHSLYKIFSTFILFFIFDYFFGKNLISFFSSGSLHLYYINHVFNKTYHDYFINLIFPSTLVLPYKEKYSEVFYAYYTYIILYLNEFFVFLFSLLLIYISFKLKNKIYDIILFILIFLNILSTILVKFHDDQIYDTDNYDFPKIINGMYNIKYPHLMLNNYFMGIFAGVICFSLRDFISNNSIVQSDNKYIPFDFLFDIFRCFGLISDKIKIIFIIIFCVVLMLLSSSFYFLEKINNKFLIKFNLIEQIIYYYEKSLIVFFYNLIIIFVYSIDYNMSKGNNFFNFFIFFSRIDFSYIITNWKFIFSFYCLYNFQLKLSYPNIMFVSFGLFMIIFIINIILTLAIVLPFKLLFKKIIS